MYTHGWMRKDCKNTGTDLNGKKPGAEAKVVWPHVIETLSVFSQLLSNLKKKIINYFLLEHMGMLIIKSETKKHSIELGMAKVAIIVIFFKASWNNLAYHMISNLTLYRCEEYVNLWGQG